MAAVKYNTALKKITDTGLYMWPGKDKTYLYTVSGNKLIRNFIENGEIMKVKILGDANKFDTTELGDKWNISTEKL